jgi:hypothetical protein
VEGSTPPPNQKKKTELRAGSGDVEAAAHTTTERIWRTLSGVDRDERT